MAFRCNFCQYFKRPQTTAHTLQHPHSKPKKNPFRLQNSTSSLPICVTSSPLPEPLLRLRNQQNTMTARAELFASQLFHRSPHYRCSNLATAQSSLRQHYPSPGKFSRFQAANSRSTGKVFFFCVPHVPRAVEINF